MHCAPECHPEGDDAMLKAWGIFSPKISQKSSCGHVAIFVLL